MTFIEAISLIGLYDKKEEFETDSTDDSNERTSVYLSFFKIGLQLLFVKSRLKTIWLISGLSYGNIDYSNNDEYNKYIFKSPKNITMDSNEQDILNQYGTPLSTKDNIHGIPYKTLIYKGFEFNIIIESGQICSIAIY